MTSGLPSFGNIPSAMFPLLEPAWSGTEFGITNPGVVDTSVSAEQRVLQMAQLPNARQPGAAWEYAADFDVLTLLLERATGQNLDELFQDRIFGPLGVEGCGFYCPPGDADRLVTNHHWSEDGSLNPVERPEDSHKVRESLGQQIAGNGLYGGVLMTPAAYTRFAAMLLNGGELDGARVLGRKTIELMTANHLGAICGTEIDLTGPGFGFGFGYAVRDRIAGTAYPGSVGTYGWGGAAGTWFFVDPTENLAGLFEKDARGNRISELPAFSGLRTLRQIAFLAEFTGLVGVFDNYVQYFTSKDYTPAFGHGCTSITIPEAFIYLDSGQIQGLLGGLAGAAWYSEMLRQRYPERPVDESLMLNTGLGVAQLVVIAFIVLGNLAGLLRPPRRRQHGTGQDVEP